jgi:hypothetical protein
MEAAMPASVRQTRIRVVGIADTLRAMRKWLKINTRVPVKFQAIKRRRAGAVTIRVDP